MLSGGVACQPQSQDQLVLTDGRFGEWEGVAPAIVDPVDAPAGSAVDFGALQIQDDPDFLHMTLETGSDVNAQSMQGTVHLVFDADGDESTGDSVMGMLGVDAVLQLSRGDAARPGGWGAGVGVRLGGPEGLGDVESAYTVGALISPTYAASRFEIRVRRHNGPEGKRLFQRSSLRLRAVFEHGGDVLDDTPIATYALRTQTRVERATPPVVELQKSDSAFRVVVWNVASNRFRDRPDAFRRLTPAAYSS